MDRRHVAVPVTLPMMRSLVMVAGGVSVLTLSAKLQAPFWPVPMTIQTLAVLCLGATYGMRHASATLLSYLLCGAAGLPVFATGAGLAYLAGPTGGYLLGFLLAATVVGWLSDRGYCRDLLPTVSMLLLGEVAIYLPGVTWLGWMIGAEKAIAGGLLPFIPAEILKLAIASAVIPLAGGFGTRS
ncbi:MAG: biotin transporter BioY [Mesorhizobium sp.]|uniref:biotin transporter BioY n=1 Tax=Mesorhizobium sp. TaxID=1871066 RepID=UPI00120AF812|nr:biotin transporter BioY [Mesorhizobium sp.]TIL32440.1 MAG: biotin transporter BioY [Mesorhizobium sp.]TIM40317.1 MAG: biotin transporter BioY [Mesorhizobium sp.]